MAEAIREMRQSDEAIEAKGLTMFKEVCTEIGELPDAKVKDAALIMKGFVAGAALRSS